MSTFGQAMVWYNMINVLLHNIFKHHYCKVNLVTVFEHRQCQGVILLYKHVCTVDTQVSAVLKGK